MSQNPIISSMEALKQNPQYQVLVKELESVRSSIESQVFDENVPFERKRELIIKRNSIKNFIELPDDLLEIEKVKE